MSASHTPGPWKVVENRLAGYGDNGANFSITAEDEVVVELPLCHKLLDYGETASYLEARANARLIAAAPDLLALLIRYRNETPLGHQPHMIAHLADVTIAKAEGNQP